ncbi:unnamed protein product [Closterium sp. NIES-54]
MSDVASGGSSNPPSVVAQLNSRQAAMAANQLPFHSSPTSSLLQSVGPQRFSSDRAPLTVFPSFSRLPLHLSCFSSPCIRLQIASSALLGSSAQLSSNATLSGAKLPGAPSAGRARVTCMAGEDRWAALGRDISDDQQDITRGKGMVDSAFQGGWGQGTHAAVLSSYDYQSQGQRKYVPPAPSCSLVLPRASLSQLVLLPEPGPAQVRPACSLFIFSASLLPLVCVYLSNVTAEGLYIAPAFMDKMVVHICKNFMALPNIRVPLILGIWGGKGQGKSFQCELVFAKMGINPIMISAGELESGNAGEPAKLIRQRYREASDLIKKGKMCALFINDLDAGAGRMGGTTQYTVNNQMVNATLMNIADNPTNVQMPGIYNKEEINRVPIIVTGNDFSTLYAPLIRDGRMDKFYWAPTRDDRIGVCLGIFREDNVSEADVVQLVDTFPGQSIDFFGALRARVYDDLVRNWVGSIGIENMGKKLVNSRSGPPEFEKPSMPLATLLEYGHLLVSEQENVKRVQLADTYLNEAALGNANADAISRGTFDGGRTPAPAPPAPAAPRAAAAPPARAAAPAAGGASGGASGLEAKSLGELRALARQRGVRGDTKAELIKALSTAPAAAAAAPAAAAAAPAGNGAAKLSSSPCSRNRNMEDIPLNKLSSCS